MTLFRAAICLSVCSCPGLCQELPFASSSPLPLVGVYESFFRTVVQRGRIAATPPEGPTAPPTSVQVALGFTDPEMLSLDAIAAASVVQLSAARQPATQWIFEARLEAIETGKESQKLTRQLKDMEVQVSRVIEQSRLQLKTALGEARFQKLDDWLHAGGANKCWVAPCTGLKH